MNRVLFLSVHSDPLAALGGVQSGGQNIYVRRLAEELATRGWSVDVLTRREDASRPREEEWAPGCRVVRLDAGSEGFVDKEELASCIPDFFREALAWIGRQEQGYRIIHSHYWEAGMVGDWLARTLSLPLVHTYHSLGVVKEKALGRERAGVSELRLGTERLLAKRSDALVVMTNAEAAVIGRMASRPAPMYCVPAGVNTDFFQPLESRGTARQDAGQEAAPYLFFAGRLVPQKGVDVLLAAYAALWRGDPQVRQSALRLVLAGGEGSGSLPDWLQPTLAGLGEVREAVRFIGPVSQERLVALYGGAVATVVPSRYEPFGLVAVEAMACASPVIASRVGGLAETVQDGRTGRLVPPGDVAALAGAMAELLRHGHRERISPAARERVVRQYTFSRTAEQVAGVYERVLQGHRIRQGA